MADEVEQLKQQLKETQQREKKLQEKCEELTDKLKEALSPETVRKIEHSEDFWTDIDKGSSKKTGPFGSDSIKTMVKTGKMTVHDTDGYNRTLLTIAARNGVYDLVQFLINNVS